MQWHPVPGEEGEVPGWATGAHHVPVDDAHEVTLSEDTVVWDFGIEGA
jgi:hypothetical protein